MIHQIQGMNEQQTSHQFQSAITKELNKIAQSRHAQDQGSTVIKSDHLNKFMESLPALEKRIEDEEKKRMKDQDTKKKQLHQALPKPRPNPHGNNK